MPNAGRAASDREKARTTSDWGSEAATVLLEIQGGTFAAVHYRS